MEKIALISNDQYLRAKLTPLVHVTAVPTMLDLEVCSIEELLKQHALQPFIGVILDTREPFHTSALEQLDKVVLEKDTPLLLVSDRRQTSILNQKFFSQPYDLIEDEMVAVVFPKMLRHLKERHAFKKQLDAAREGSYLEVQSRLKLLENSSHEFRVLYNSLLASLELLAGEQPNDITTKQLEQTKSIGREMSELLERLTPSLHSPSTFPKKSEGFFSIRDRLNKLTVAYLMRARAKKIRFVRAVHADVPDLLRGNFLKLEWILLHLLNHAFESTTENGYISLYVHIESSHANVVELHFAISETADGESNEPEHVLMLRRDLTREIVFRLSEELGGKSWTDSEQGLGSTNHLLCTFDKYLGPVKAEQPRVLLVDDNATNRLVASRMLEKKGYTVVVAKDGLEAIELYRATKVDLILMDIQMPFMDGLEATQKIREIESSRNGTTPDSKMKIIAVTAHVSDEHREMCLAAGMDAYVAKPVDYGALCKLMDGFIDEILIEKRS